MGVTFSCLISGLKKRKITRAAFAWCLVMENAQQLIGDSKKLGFHTLTEEANCCAVHWS
jgi:hypothetical protein